MSTTPSPEVQAEFERGLALVDDGQYDEGIAVFNAVLAQVPDHAEAFLHRGRCWDHTAEPSQESGSQRSSGPTGRGSRPRRDAPASTNPRSPAGPARATSTATAAE